MRPHMLKELPAAPKNKSGWPWTKESKPLSSKMKDGNLWPKISIVTPSYNQGQFFEETIRSVLLQNYPNLEYIIIDGGSTDNSVEIIRKYEPWLTYWVSNKDNGQADAINRGFEKSTGEIIGWINSDDYYLPSALFKVAKALKAKSETDLLIGGGIVVDEKGGLLRKNYSFPQSFDSLLEGGQFFLQMSSFWWRESYYAVGGLDTSLRFCFDYELFLRLTKKRNPAGIESMLSAFRLHNKSKTSLIWESVALPEIDTIKVRYGFNSLSLATKKHLYDQVIHNFYLITRTGILCDAIRDPCYFLRCMVNKIKGNPGSPLLDINSNRFH